MYEGKNQIVLRGLCESGLKGLNWSYCITKSLLVLWSKLFGKALQGRAVGKAGQVCWEGCTCISLCIGVTALVEDFQSNFFQSLIFL